MRFQTGYYFGKEMAVQQEFEKGRSHRLWLRRYARLNNQPFFSGSHVWGGGGGGGGLYAILYGTCIYVCVYVLSSFRCFVTISWCNPPPPPPPPPPTHPTWHTVGLKDKYQCCYARGFFFSPLEWFRVEIIILNFNSTLYLCKLTKGIFYE